MLAHTETSTPDLLGIMGLDAVELEVMLDAVDDRLETATPDLIGALRRGRRALELELAVIISRT